MHVYYELSVEFSFSYNMGQCFWLYFLVENNCPGQLLGLGLLRKLDCQVSMLLAKSSIQLLHAFPILMSVLSK